MAKEYQYDCPWLAEAEVAKGHTLQRDPDFDNRIDTFAMNYDFCNGPRCVVCHDCWCMHCTAAKDIKPCKGP